MTDRDLPRPVERPPAPNAFTSLAAFLRALEPARDTCIAPPLAILL